MANACGSAPPETSKVDSLEDEDYFMTVAHATAMRSKDPNTKVGACIVKDGKIVALGYNDIPVDVKDSIWQSSDKHFFVCYAVTQAIVNARPEDLKDATVYTTLFPSDKCATNMIQSGIVKLVYATTNLKYMKKPWLKASVNMLKKKPIKHVFYKPTISEPLIIDLHTKDRMPVELLISESESESFLAEHATAPFAAP